ncbi:DUF433 domain-containing protein [Ornithinimicrobium pekingense]|nr:DUF433 domain-containing protein [Ornithinimicrobium pekingense]
MDFNDHPSEYRFVTDGHLIALLNAGDEAAIDLTKRPGSQIMNFSLQDVFESFVTRNGKPVVPFQRPTRGIQVELKRMGGWPTIEGTRIAYDTISGFIGNEETNFALLHHFYPGVSDEAARGAVELTMRVGAAS